MHVSNLFMFSLQCFDVMLDCVKSLKRYVQSRRTKNYLLQEIKTCCGTHSAVSPVASSACFQTRSAQTLDLNNRPTSFDKG